MTDFIDIHHHRNNRNGIRSVFHFDCLPNESFSVGIHPWHTSQIANFDEVYQKLNQLAFDKNCRAIGEIGLDRLRGAALELQTKIFSEQLQIAKTHQKPIIVHCVKCYYEIINILKKSKFNQIVIFHNYNANRTITTILKEMPNVYFSFGASVLNRNSASAKIISQIPIERIFMETDESEIPILNIYTEISEVFGIELEDLKQVIENNFSKAFAFCN